MRPRPIKCSNKWLSRTNIKNDRRQFHALASSYLRSWHWRAAVASGHGGAAAAAVPLVLAAGDELAEDGEEPRHHGLQLRPAVPGHALQPVGPGLQQPERLPNSRYDA